MIVSSDRRSIVLIEAESDSITGKIDGIELCVEAGGEWRCHHNLQR
jgi:hypothetical protein